MKYRLLLSQHRRYAIWQLAAHPKMLLPRVCYYRSYGPPIQFVRLHLLFLVNFTANRLHGQKWTSWRHQIQLMLHLLFDSDLIDDECTSWLMIDRSIGQRYPIFEPWPFEDYRFGLPLMRIRLPQ